MADLRYCPASWGSARCSLKYDHAGMHRDSLLGTEWPRLEPRNRPGKTGGDDA